MGQQSVSAVFTVNCDDEEEYGNQSRPAIAYDSTNGHFFVAWEDDRDYGTSGIDIYGQVVAGCDPFIGPCETRCFKLIGSEIDEPISTSIDDEMEPAIAYDSRKREVLGRMGNQRRLR
jgi:hypothetical protein